MTESINNARAASDSVTNARADGQAGSMPLLGLEPTSTENTGQNQAANGEAETQPVIFPLLGTICSSVGIRQLPKNL